MNTGNINFKGTIQQVENGKPYPERSFNNDKAVLNLFEHRVSTEKIADVSTNMKDTVSFSLGNDTQVSMKPEKASGLVLTITKTHDEANKTIIKLFQSCKKINLKDVFSSLIEKASKSANDEVVELLTPKEPQSIKKSPQQKAKANYENIAVPDRYKTPSEKEGSGIFHGTTSDASDKKASGSVAIPDKYRTPSEKD